MTRSPRWTGDLPRALCRALLVALLGSQLVLLMPTRDALMAVEFMCALGAASIPLTLLEGRLAARRPRAGPARSLLLLWATGFALWAALFAQTAWVVGLTRGGVDGALAELGRLARGIDASFFAVGLLASAVVALASFRWRIERREHETVGSVALTLLLAITIVPGLLYLAATLVMVLGDKLAETVARRRLAPAAARLRALVASRRLSPEALWLLAYVGDADACAALGDEPRAPDDLRAWVERLEEGGPYAPAAAAITVAREALRGPGAGEDASALDIDPRSPTARAAVEAGVAAEEGRIEEPRAEVLRAASRAVRACVGAPAPVTDVARHAADAAVALVASGRAPHEVRARMVEALRAWVATTDEPAVSA